MSWYQHTRRILEHVVQIGPGRTSKLEHITETACTDQCSARAIFFENRVGHHGGRMRQQRHLIRLHTITIERTVQAAQHRFAEITRSSGRFGNTNGTVDIVDQRNICESTADINTETPCHLYFSYSV